MCACRYVIFPTIFLVVLSYASFYLARAAVPARVAVTMISILTLWNLNASVRDGLPKQKGEKCVLLDFLFGSSIFCCFSALVRVILQLHHPCGGAGQGSGERLPHSKVARRRQGSSRLEQRPTGTGS